MQAKALMTEALMVYQRSLPPDHPETADCMDKVIGTKETILLLADDAVEVVSSRCTF